MSDVWKVPTYEIESVLVGRCLDDQVLKPLVHLDPTVNCTTFVGDLTSVWQTTNDTDISTSTYDDLRLFERADFESRKDSSIFWAGVPKSLVNDYTNSASRYTQMVETPGGGLMTDLSGFCAHDVFDETRQLCYKPYERLSPWDKSLNEGMGGFSGAAPAWWQGASREFAKYASGHTHIFLYAQKQYATAFYDRTILARVEIPALDPSKITKVTILFAKELGYTGDETCTSEGSSIQDAIDLLKETGFSEDVVECVDDPWEIDALLCLENPEDKSCKVFQSLDTSTSKRDENLIVAGWTLFGIFFFATVFLTFAYMKNMRRAKTGLTPQQVMVNQDILVDTGEVDDQSRANQTTAIGTPTGGALEHEITI